VISVYINKEDSYPNRRLVLKETSALRIYNAATYVTIMTVRRGNIKETNFFHYVFLSDFKQEGRTIKCHILKKNFSENFHCFTVHFNSLNLTY